LITACAASHQVARPERDAEAGEDSANGGVLDGGDNAQAAAAVGTRQDIETLNTPPRSSAAQERAFTVISRRGATCWLVVSDSPWCRRSWCQTWLVHRVPSVPCRHAGGSSVRSVGFSWSSWVGSGPGFVIS